jgi:hypothetical protein
MVARVAESTGDLPRAAKDLVQLNPDVILAGASAMGLAAKMATTTIPIVVPALGNPVALGLIETEARPGGNLTGIMPYVKGLPAKQLELAREIVPGALKIGIVNNSADVKARGQWDAIVSRQTLTSKSAVPMSGSPKISSLRSKSLKRSTSSIPQIRGGQVRALAVSSATRLPALPDVPTVAEYLPDYAFESWLGIAGPKNLPAEIVEVLNREINASLARSEIKAKYDDLGLRIHAGSPADFGKLIADDTEKWRKVIRAANIRAE